MNRQITKRSLGVNYVAWIGVVMGSVLLAQIIHEWTYRVPIWALTGLVPALALITARYWLPLIDLDDNQIWLVAQCGALGMAVVTGLAMGTYAVSNLMAEPVTEEIGIIASHITTGAIVGVLAGALWEVHNTNSRMTVRTNVLNRVLRHNLRNDVTVIRGHLEHVQATADEPHEGQIDVTLDKLDQLIELTEKVRAVDTALERGRQTHRPINVVAAIDSQLDEIATTRPSVTVDCCCPDEAWVLADEMFASLLDNVVESAAIHGTGDPRLHVTVTTTGRTVELGIEDDGNSLPAADLAVVADGAETKLDHGCGIELWLVEWLVGKYNGDLTITQTDTGKNRLDIELPRADTSSWLGF